MVQWPRLILSRRAGIGLFGCSAGDAVGDFARRLAGLFVDGYPFDDEGLADVGKVEIAVECGGGPDLSRFDASMVGWVMHDEVGLFSVLKVYRDIVKQRGLVGFDGEVIVGLAFWTKYSASLRWVSRASAVMSLPSISIASSSGMAMPISLVCLIASLLSATRQCADFFWV